MSGELFQIERAVQQLEQHQFIKHLAFVEHETARRLIAKQCPNCKGLLVHTEQPRGDFQ